MRARRFAQVIQPVNMSIGNAGATCLAIRVTDRPQVQAGQQPKKGLAGCPLSRVRRALAFSGRSEGICPLWLWLQKYQ